MSGYSYSEIQNMQQKAMERVREMKRTSDEIAKTAQKDLESEHKNIDYRGHKSSVSAKVTNMPPNFPENTAYPNFNEFFKTEQERIQEKEKPLKRKDNSKQNTIQNLFDEPDKALILGLIMLLKSEGADEVLIMALSYILS